MSATTAAPAPGAAPVHIGMDLGTTNTKAMAVDAAGQAVCVVSRPTVWDRPRTGWAEQPAQRVVAAVDALLAEVVSRAGERLGAGVRVRSVGFTSMAESGALVDPAGAAVSPVIAWFDPRGEEELATLDPEVAALFPGVTGLVVSPLASFFKLRWMAGQGLLRPGAQWLSVAELVCHHLGADRFSERSLLGRTGLLDVHTGRPSALLLDALGVDPAFVPPVVGAGAPLGTIRPDHPVAAARGAVLTVAGHDHLVAAAGAGAARWGTVFDSMGTAEAFVAATDHVPDADTVATMVAGGLAVYPHVVADTTAVLAGTKSGLVLQRVLRLLGREDATARAALDAAALAGTLGGDLDTGDVVVTGCRMSDFEVGVEVRGDGCTPEQVWSAAVSATTRTAEEVLGLMREAGATANTVVVAGGWAHLESIVRGRRALAPTVRLAAVRQSGVHGAALFGSWAAEQAERGAAPPEHPSPGPGWFEEHQATSTPDHLTTTPWRSE